MEYKNIKLLNDLVVVKPWSPDEIHGLIIPETAKDNTQKGYVVAVGPGVYDHKKGVREPLQVQIGDKVLYTKYAGSEIKFEEGPLHLIMREGDILGFYKGPNEADLQPLDNRLFLEWEEAPEEWKGTFILRPHGAPLERYYTGNVLGVGPNAYDVKVGERVFFDQFCGPEKLVFHGKRYAIILDTDVFCVIPSRLEMKVVSQ